MGSLTEHPAGLSNLSRLRGMRSWLLSSALASVYTAVTAGAYSTGYALFLGASNAQVGLLSAAPAWGQVLQLFSPLLIERLPRRKTLCLIAYALGYSVWLPVALIPIMVAGELRPVAMIVLVALAGVVMASAAPASTSWLSDLVPGQVRARFVARQQSTIAAIGLAASLIAGRYLDLFSEGGQRTGFVVLFVVAVAFGLGAVAAWARVPEPPQVRADRISVRHVLALPLADVNLRRYTLFVAARTTAVMIAAPFFTVYMLKNLQIPYSQIAIFSAINTVAMIAANPVWAYLADKFGHKPVLQLSGLALAPVPLLWFLTTRDNYLYVTPIAMLWAGVMAAGVILSQLNLIMKIAPAENRSVYMGFHSAVASVAIAVGSMIGGALGDLFARWTPLELYGHKLTSLHLVFLVSTVGRATSMVLVRRVSEAGAQKTRVMLARVGSGKTLATAWNLWRMAHSRGPEAKAHSVRALGDAHSRLPVDELIELLDDADHEVRREAARALGMIGDERALGPLIERAGDEATGIAAEAVEALGHIDSQEGRKFLVGLLESDQPSMREMAAIALGTLAHPEAAEPLAALIGRETHPTVLLAAARGLSRTGGARALGPLLELLASTPKGIARRELANAIGDLLSKPGQFYKLLQAEPLRQEELVDRLLRRSARTAGHLQGATRADRQCVREHSSRAFDRFTMGDYGTVIRELLGAASRAALVASRGRSQQGASSSPSSPRELIASDERLAISHAALKGLSVKSGHWSPGRDEALLATFAFSVFAERLGQLHGRG